MTKPHFLYGGLCVAGIVVSLVLAQAIQHSHHEGKTFTAPLSGRTVHANVVAIDQPLFYNRFGSVNPFGMMYALRRDTAEFAGGEWLPGLSCPISEWLAEGQTKLVLREGERPRPLVLRGNVGDVLEIKFTNELLDKQPDLSRCTAGKNSYYTNLSLTDAEFEAEYGDVDAEPRPCLL